MQKRELEREELERGEAERERGVGGGGQEICKRES